MLRSLGRNERRYISCIPWIVKKRGEQLGVIRGVPIDSQTILLTLPRLLIRVFQDRNDFLREITIQGLFSLMSCYKLWEKTSFLLQNTENGPKSVTPEPPKIKKCWKLYLWIVDHIRTPKGRVNQTVTL